MPVLCARCCEARGWRARTKRPQAVGKEAHGCSDQDRESLCARRAKPDRRIEHGEARVVHHEAARRNEAEPAQVAASRPAARREGPDAEQHEVEQAVQHERDAERRIRSYPCVELTRVERDRQEIAAPDHDPVAHQLTGDTRLHGSGVVGCRARHRLRFTIRMQPSHAASASAAASSCNGRPGSRKLAVNS
jgi:hypothetical protein